MTLFQSEVYFIVQKLSAGFQIPNEGFKQFVRNYVDFRSALSKAKFVYIYSLVGLRSLCKGLASRQSAELTQNVSVSVAPLLKNDSPHILKLIELM